MNISLSKNEIKVLVIWLATSVLGLMFVIFLIGELIMNHNWSMNIVTYSCLVFSMVFVITHAYDLVVKIIK